MLHVDGTLTDYGRNIVEGPYGERSINGDMLAASTPRPDRLLLDYERTTTDGQRAEAKYQAKLIGGISVLPAIAVAAVVKEVSGMRELTLALTAAIMLAVGIYTYWRLTRIRTRAYEQTKWLDFETNLCQFSDLGEPGPLAPWPRSPGRAQFRRR